MFVGLILTGILLYFTHTLADEPRELIFIMFWFAGDTLCDYIFLTGRDLRHNRRMAGRLASIKAVFPESIKNRIHIICQNILHRIIFWIKDW